MSPALQRRRWLALAAGSAGVLAAGLGVGRLALAQSDGLPPAQTAKLFGVNIRYVELGQRGDKPTLVLLHDTAKLFLFIAQGTIDQSEGSVVAFVARRR